MNTDKIDAAQFEAARAWAAGLGLEYAGVDLADCVAYNFLTVTGRIWLAHLNPPAEEGAANG